MIDSKRLQEEISQHHSSYAKNTEHVSVVSFHLVHDLFQHLPFPQIIAPTRMANKRWIFRIGRLVHWGQDLRRKCWWNVDDEIWKAWIAWVFYVPLLNKRVWLVTVLWCFLAFVFFCQFGGDSWVSGCLWTFLEDVKLLQRSDVFIGQGSRGFAILLCNFASKSLKDFLWVFDSHSFGIYRFLSKTIFDWLTPVGAMEVTFRI